MQRQTHNVAPGEVHVREGEDDGDGLFRVRMPVSSTAEARDGKAFTRERLDGFARQIEAGDVGVFLDHGRNAETGSRYSALGKVGYWADPEVVAARDDGADLVADAVLADPAELDADVGEMRELLAWLKTQAELGIPMASSVGWSEDTGDRDVPGGADLLEISIVGIPSDPTTTTASAEPAAMARAVSAASTDFDVATFVRELTAQADRNTVEVGGEEIDLTPPDAVQTAATLGLAKDDELDPDCGTGAGRESARQIAGNDVTADRIDDIAAYLTSHEEDVTADGPPSDWSDEEWQDCGNLQYALWGGTGTGTGLEWAQDKANQVAAAQDEELPYPDRSNDDAQTTSTHTTTMSDDNSEPDEASGTDTDEPDLRAMEEEMAELREMMEENTRKTREMHEEMMGGDGDEDEDGDEESADAEDADRDDEPDGERTIEIDGEQRSVADVRDELADLREQASDATPADPETQDRATDAEDSDEDDTSGGFGYAALEE